MREEDQEARQGSGRGAGGERPRNIEERSFVFALRIIRLTQDLNTDGVGRLLAKQVLRAGTSIGANVAEAQAAQSKADFVSKMSIAHKEAREVGYWLRLLVESGLTAPPKLDGLRNEADELRKILASIILSAKRRAPR